MAENLFKVGNMTVDDETFVVTVGKESTRLTRAEFQIVRFISQHSTASRQELYDLTKLSEGKNGVRNIDVAVCRLKKRIPSWNLKSERGKGYKILYDKRTSP